MPGGASFPLSLTVSSQVLLTRCLRCNSGLGIEDEGLMSGHTRPYSLHQTQKNPCSEALYSPPDRHSIPLQRLFLTPLLQACCMVPSDRPLVDRIGFDLLIHRSISLGVDGSVWVARTSSSNRNRLQENDTPRKPRARLLAVSA